MKREQLRQMFRDDPERCRAFLEAELRKDAGSAGRTALRFGVGRRAIEILLSDLGLRGLPARIREEQARRYRLPPLDGGIPGERSERR